MEVVSLDERKLEKLIDGQASEYHGCDIYKLMGYASALESINSGNPFVDLAEGILYAKYRPPNHSYARSVWHLNLFLKFFPYNEHAVWWRLDSATSLVSDKPFVKFLSRFAKEAVESFPNKIPILNAAYVAYSQGVCDYRESLKVGLRILYLDPDDDQIRKNVHILNNMLKEELASRRSPKVVKLRGVNP